MWSVNPTWSSPRIRDELAKLGMEASTATIRKYRPNSRGRPSPGWRTFLRNRASAITAMEFFVVPTVTGRMLYVLVAITQERRKVIQFKTTEAPTAAHEFRRTNRALIAAQNVLRNRRRSSFHKPRPFNVPFPRS